MSFAIVVMVVVVKVVTSTPFLSLTLNMFVCLDYSLVR